MTTCKKAVERRSWQGMPVAALRRALDQAEAAGDREAAIAIIEQIYQFYDDLGGKGVDPTPNPGPGPDGLLAVQPTTVQSA